MKANYYDDRNYKNLQRLEQLLETELPPFCREYFLGIAPRTTPLTQLNYAHDLKIFFYYLCQKKWKHLTIDLLEIADLDTLTATDLEYFLNYLSYYTDKDGAIHKNSERGQARALASLRSMFRYFFNKDKLKANVAAKVDTPKLHSKEIVRLEVNEVAELLDEAESGLALSPHQRFYHQKTAVRDVAILTLFLGTGIRISECIGLDVDDINFSDNSFSVTRKGGNRTILYFPKEVGEALKDWLRDRACWNNMAPQETALFLSMRGVRICARSVEDIVKKYAKIVSPLKHISPHKLRSTFGTNLYRETQDIYMVAEVLGHRDVNTTKKHYAAMSEDIKRTAATKVKLRQDD